MEAEEALRELRALVERAGGRRRLLLVAERRPGEAPARALLESFARDLLGEPAGGGVEAAAAAGRGAGGGGSGRGWPWCALAFVLCRPAAGRRERRRLRELLRDVRAQLPPAAALVGVLLLLPPEAAAGTGPAERERLEALLRRVCAPSRPALHEALQAAHYSPGSPQGAAPARAAACRALRAALTLRAEGVETEKQRLPGFLQCFPWGRRSQKADSTSSKPADTFGDDILPEAEEGVALTNMAPNGNCEEIGGVAGT